jgi:hypothetical protein
MQDLKMNALKELLKQEGCDHDRIDNEGDPLSYFSSGNREYRVMTEQERAREFDIAVTQSLGHFNPEFIVKQTNVLNCQPMSIQERLIDALTQAAQSIGEDMGPIYHALLASNEQDVSRTPHDTPWQEFLSEVAAESNGRGHYLSPYDGVEHEVTADGVNYFYIYRMN